jgi:dipeptidase E
MKKSIFLLSSSNVHGYGFLEYNKAAIMNFLGPATKIVFVPFAAGAAEWDTYTARIEQFFLPSGIEVTGVHRMPQGKTITDFDVLFIGGGNTFRLLNELQQRKLMPEIRTAVKSGLISYMGSSAGTNMATKSIFTTNDMPIVYPTEGFDALNFFTYQINPHYLDPDPESNHKGETRDQRIAEFHQEHDTPVVGLREGSYILIGPDFETTNEMYIGGSPGAKIFRRNETPYEAPREVLFNLRHTTAD